MKQTVLLVDDEATYVQAMAERLALRGFAPSVACSGEDALRSIAREQPSAMVLDLRMPGMDGLEVLRQVRERFPGTRVVILTGHGTDKDREECVTLGAAAFFNKPIGIEILAQALRDKGEQA